MKITHLQTNHLKNPIGYFMDQVTVSYLVEEAEGKRQISASVQVAGDPEFQRIIYDSGERGDVDPTGFAVPIELTPSTRYFWRIRVTTDAGERAVSDVAWFETPKENVWKANWIAPLADKKVQVCLTKRFFIDKPVARARMYMVGLGLYELYLNGQRQGEECLLPGFCDYDAWIPYQTFPLELSRGENEVRIYLGDGWYKGAYGLRKKEENYGDRLACIGEIHIWFTDGTSTKILTDSSWLAQTSPVTASGIYSGEVYDPAAEGIKQYGVEEISFAKEKLMPRLNPPITVERKISPQALLYTPAGEWVLDMGQNMVGWLEFVCREPAGTKIFLQFGEILQDGNFYRDNLRTAEASFTYLSDGKERLVRQHFTFYGFRYVKLTGFSGKPDPEDFRGLVIHSAMEDISRISTSNALVNKLYENVKWGQRGNFLDLPTDCPQRDERYGWTGDAQVFSGTACYNMDTYSFYRKFCFDLFCEQKALCGAVPDTVPVANNRSTISAVWGDAATIIPWNVYLHSGDKEILRRQFPSMKAWVDYIRGQDISHGDHYLWKSGFHYGDWLALDGRMKGGVFGATDPFFIASAFYYFSADIVAKAAEALGEEEEAGKYRALSLAIRDAFIKEYYTQTGRLAVDTMTAYVLALYLGLFPEGKERLTEKGLYRKLRENRYHLETGFVGTPYLLRVLSEHGMNDLAYHLLLTEEYPGWLYQVKMGATTVWERWDSVLPDGKISGTEMNSLNHYAEGAVVEWMYRDMLGIQPMENAPGFRRFRVVPKPNFRLSEACGRVETASGEIRSAWQLRKGKLTVELTVPFGTEAEWLLPDAALSEVKNGLTAISGVIDMRQEGGDVCVKLAAGRYRVSYIPTVPYRKIYSIDSSVKELLENPKTRRILDEDYFPYNEVIPFAEQMYTLREYLNGPFTNLPEEEQREIDQKLREVE